MGFALIDLEHWKRREYFDHYFADVPCTYSMTVKIDVTSLQTSGHKLYPAMLHALARVVNRHEEFRTCLDETGRPGVFDQLCPSYTVFHQDSETFSNLWTEYSEDFMDFNRAYQRDLAEFGSIPQMEAKPNAPANTFPVSMVPWESFEGFHLNLQKGYQYLLPIFTIGKYCEENGRYLLPLAVQVHHAVCDGFHICRFVEELRALCNSM